MLPNLLNEDAEREEDAYHLRARTARGLGGFKNWNKLFEKVALARKESPDKCQDDLVKHGVCVFALVVMPWMV